MYCSTLYLYTINLIEEKTLHRHIVNVSLYFPVRYGKQILYQSIRSTLLVLSYQPTRPIKYLTRPFRFREMCPFLPTILQVANRYQLFHVHYPLIMIICHLCKCILAGVYLYKSETFYDRTSQIRKTTYSQLSRSVGVVVSVKIVCYRHHNYTFHLHIWSISEVTVMLGRAHSFFIWSQYVGQF